MFLGENSEPQAEHRLHGRLAEKSKAEGQSRRPAERRGQRRLARGQGGRRRGRGAGLPEAHQGRQKVKTLGREGQAVSFKLVRGENAASEPVSGGPGPGQPVVVWGVEVHFRDVIPSSHVKHRVEPSKNSSENSSECVFV